jgi:hypothetical protein
MLRRFFHSQFFAKLFCELLPATIASAIGAYMINSYFKPPAPQPQAATAASAELVQIMREQQALLSDYLKKSTEAHQHADQAVAQETDKLKSAERDAIQALREAKAAELRALAAAVTRAGEASERKLAAKSTPAPAPTAAAAPPVQWPPVERAHVDKAQTEKAVAGEPLQLHQAASAAPQPQIAAQGQNQPQAQPRPASPQEAAAAETDSRAFAKLKSAVSTVRRLPSRVLDWFSDTIVPPRPPVDLPPRQFMKAAM